MEQWVKGKKEEAMRKRLMSQPMGSFNLPSMAFTGAGPDGMIQPGQPAGMDPRGFIQHEGEMKANIPEGTFVLNAPTTQKAYQGMVYPTFQAGGFNPGIDPLKIAGKISDAAQNKPTTAPPVAAQTREPVKVDQSLTMAPAIKQPVTTTVPTQTKPPEETKPVEPIKPVLPGSPIETPKVPSAEDTARTTGLNYMTGTLNKTNEAATLEGKKQMDELSARQQQERSALEQKLIQSGADPGQARVESQILRNQQEKELNDLGAQYGIAGMEARERTAENLAATGLAGQQFEEDKARYGDSKAWTDFEYTAQYGSDADVIAAYKAATGKDLDPSAVAEVRGYARTKRSQDVEAGQMTLESTRNKLGDETYTSIQNMINGGSSLAAINERLRSQGKEPMTADEFKGMLDATPLGERNWGRSLTAANMLLTTPGANNKYEAQQMYNELFPNVSFDFDKLVDQEKFEDFSDGLSTMASYVASGMDYDEAFTLLQEGGVASKLGIKAQDLAPLYHAMEVNAIDAEWEEMENSDFYKSLEPDEQADQQEFFRQKMLGNLDYETLHEYEITGPNGYSLTIYGKNQTEANNKAASLGTGYSVKDTGNVKFQMASTITDTEPTTQSGNVSDKPVGTIYKEDNRVYKVGAGGVIEEAKFDAATDDPWSDSTKDIFSQGKEGNPYYSLILEARAKSVIDGSHSIGNDLKESDPELYDKILSTSENSDMGAYKKMSEKKGKKTITRTEFKSIPPVGNVLKYDGKLYKVAGEMTSYVRKDGNITSYVPVIDLATGKTVNIWTKPEGGTDIH